METEKRFKKRYVLLLIIVILFGPKLYRYINYELTKDELVIGNVVKGGDITSQLKKIEYSNLEELEEYVDDIFVFITLDEINNLVYTLKEDNLEEWYYDLVYTKYDRGQGQTYRWFIYDLLINEQYCYSKFNEDYSPYTCYISEDETKEVVLWLSEGEDPKAFKFFGSGQILSSTGEITTYSSIYSDELLEAIDNAYIISQGEGTPGYEEAMRASYKLVEHKTQDNYNQFKGSYARNMERNAGELKEIRDMNLEEIIENYDEYSMLIKIVESMLML